MEGSEVASDVPGPAAAASVDGPVRAMSPNAVGETRLEGRELGRREHRVSAAAVPLSLPIRRPSRRRDAVGGALVVAIAALLILSVARNPNIDYSVIGRYLGASAILSGLLVTVELAVTSMAVGIALGILLAVARLSHKPVLRAVSWFYIYVFRGTPLLVQILMWGNIALFFKHIDLGIPFVNVVFVSVRTNALITTFVAAVLGLGLNEGAYMAEIFRSGISAIDRGQWEAAHSIGLTRRQALRRVVLPQAIRVAVPPTGNQFISMFKATALVSVIAGGDLLTQAETIYSSNYQTIALLIVASFWYIVITSVAYVGQYFVERRLDRSVVRSLA